MPTRPSPIVISTTVLLAVGLSLQVLLWSRQWIYGDQYALLTPAVEYLATGELAPFSKGMSGGGRIPGTLLQWAIATPLRLWQDFRAPAMAMGISQLAAMLVLLAVGVSAYGRRFAPALVAVFWLTPWRLYHAGFLWEPGFLLLPAALHLGCCWLLRPTSSTENESGGNAQSIAGDESGARAQSAGIVVAASFGLGAILPMTLQIHASFLVLLLATGLLAWRGRVRPRLGALAAGTAAGSLTLVPTLTALASGELPRIAPQIDDRVALPLLVVSNAGKAAAYWFRMGSADIGRRLRQTIWLDGPPAGIEEPQLLPSALLGIVVVLSTASILIALHANGRYFLRPDASTNSWLRSYTLTMFAALTLAGALSPVPVQGWHVLIALHAACIPTAWWVAQAVRHGGAQRILAGVFVALLLATSVLVGLGHPTYLRPDEETVARQNIPSGLRHLIPPGSR